MIGLARLPQLAHFSSALAVPLTNIGEMTGPPHEPHVPTTL
jgi:hypothetical protein